MDGSCGPQTEIKLSYERGSMLVLLTFVCMDLFEAHTDLFFILVFFSFLFLNLKLPIMPFSYFVIQFNIKTFGIKL